jgi:hypothetical protein
MGIITPCCFANEYLPPKDVENTMVNLSARMERFGQLALL